MISVLDSPIVFCDVETTGTNPANCRITEIACIRYENGHETNRLVTLINPEQSIPYNITRLTGITNQMVIGQPKFRDIAPQVADILQNAILCAHHARFDYGFIKAELQKCGHNLESSQLCTAKLSRALFPAYNRHGLSQLIDRFDLVCNDRHRALGDVEVLIQFAELINKKFDTQTVENAIHRQSSKINTPPNLDIDQIVTLPSGPGVYSFYGKNNEVLYIGKSINIRQRVLSHFSNANRNAKSRRMWHETYRIETDVTASDLGASLLESFKIKTELPIYNRQLRRSKKLWAVTKITSNPIRLEITPFDISQNFQHIYAIYKTKAKAKSSLNQLAEQFNLCPKLLGLEKSSTNCFWHQLDKCRGACANKINDPDYDDRVEQAFLNKRMREWPYKDKLTIHRHNPNNHFTEEFIINNWILEKARLSNPNNDKALFDTDSFKFDYDMYKILSKHLD